MSNFFFGRLTFSRKNGEIKDFSAAEIWAILESFSSYKDKFFIVILKTFNIDTLYMYKNRGKNGFLLNDPEITQNVPKFKNSPKLILTK